MNPKPIGWIPHYGGPEGPVHLEHDCFGRARFTVLAYWYFRPRLDAPARQANPITDAGVKRAMVTQRKYGWGRRGRAVMTEKRQAQTRIARMLIRKQPQHYSLLFHETFQSTPLETPFEEQATGAFPERLQQPIE